ncbi:MAG: hypothetical protein M3014_12810 [Chloroflexota bacterium]|nr:hypothetical protein [Chloroflexota bacterium]
MIAALLTLLITALGCAVLSASSRWKRLARTVALTGVAVALGISLWQEGLRALGQVIVAWPTGLGWLGQSPYASDAFSAGMGSWCLLLGAGLLYKMGIGEQTEAPMIAEEAPLQLALSVLTLADLYSLVHLDNLLTFAGHMLALALLTWAYSSLAGSDDDAGLPRRNLALGAGAVLVLCAALLIGRTTGGVYSLATAVPGALTVWPVVLLGLGILLWLGCIPATGWSSRGMNGAGGSGAYRVMVQTLVVGLPVLALLLRIEAGITNEATAGTVPPEWTALAGALQWLGGSTALAAGAGCLVWAGLPRWSAMLTACTMGLMLWAVSLDSPDGRLAAIAILLAYGAGNLGVEMLRGSVSSMRNYPLAMCIFSRLCVPLTAGFVGLWLLVGSISETKHPALALVVLGSTILAACGGVIHEAIGEAHDKGQKGPVSLWVGTGIAALLLIGGIVPGLWLPQAEFMAGIAGGSPSTHASWQGLAVTGATSGAGTALPLGWIGAGALLLVGAFVLLRAGIRGGYVEQAGVLLPTALGRGENLPGELSHKGQSSPLGGLLANPPSPIWWLSLAWLDAGVWGTGILIGRLVGRGGVLLRIAQTRLYVPLVLVIVIVVLLLGMR